MSKISCNDCAHKKVCSIFEFAVKWNRESVSSGFRSTSMVEVCGHFLSKELIIIPKEVKDD